MMSTGVVKWFNAREGFGSIQPDSGDHDIFVHISALKMSGIDSITQGQIIFYEIVSDLQTGRHYAEKLNIPKYEQFSETPEIGNNAG